MKLQLGKNLAKMISAKTHVKCRGNIYPRSNIARLQVPDEKVDWNVDWPDYNPISYTAPHLINSEKLPPWADQETVGVGFNPKWNDIDGKINRKSHMGIYEVVKNIPRNPKGRTGIQGRGCLGRWGPNHAADPIVTRWKREKDDKGSLIQVCNDETTLPILQFVAIKRKDCGEWAIPGGMVDPGEDYTSTLLREFLEEALNIDDCSDVEERRNIVNQVSRFFRDIAVRHMIHSGYVDDPRNTDNAWMETMAVNFHQSSESPDECLPPLKAGSDAALAEWVDICKSKDFYANHSELLHGVASLRCAHW